MELSWQGHYTSDYFEYDRTIKVSLVWCVHIIPPLDSSWYEYVMFEWHSFDAMPASLRWTPIHWIGPKWINIQSIVHSLYVRTLLPSTHWRRQNRRQPPIYGSRKSVRLCVRPQAFVWMPTYFSIHEYCRVAFCFCAPDLKSRNRMFMCPPHKYTKSMDILICADIAQFFNTDSNRLVNLGLQMRSRVFLPFAQNWLGSNCAHVNRRNKLLDGLSGMFIP